MSQRMYYAKQAYGDVYKGAAAKRDFGIQQKDRYGRSTTPGLDKAFGNIGGFLDDKLDGAQLLKMHKMKSKKVTTDKMRVLNLCPKRNYNKLKRV